MSNSRFRSQHSSAERDRMRWQALFLSLAAGRCPHCATPGISYRSPLAPGPAGYTDGVCVGCGWTTHELSASLLRLANPTTFLVTGQELTMLSALQDLALRMGVRGKRLRERFVPQASTRAWRTSVMDEDVAVSTPNTDGNPSDLGRGAHERVSRTPVADPSVIPEVRLDNPPDVTSQSPSPSPSPSPSLSTQ